MPTIANPVSRIRPALLAVALACSAPAPAADQDRVARDMVQVLEAYAVYKMGQYEEAFSRYLDLAEAGNVQGMLNVANMYAAGQGVETDPEKALTWYRRAAEAGDGIGMYQLAQAYEQGRGVAADPGAAASWYRRAAEHDNSDAQWLIGRRLYDRGETLTGLGWIKTAARQGNPSAQRFLGDLEGGTTPTEAQQTAARETLAAIDAAAGAQDAAAMMAPISGDADIRVRLPDGPGWESLTRAQLQALWQATFDRAGEYRYRRSRPELLAADGAVLAFSRIDEQFAMDDPVPELEIRETATLRLEGDTAVIERLRLDIRNPLMD